MKEALIYDMYQFIGADVSLYNYAKVSVNGEYWGVYLALEAVDESFMLRNFGTQDGELYKPDSMEMGGGEKSSSSCSSSGFSSVLLSDSASDAFRSVQLRPVVQSAALPSSPDLHVHGTWNIPVHSSSS
jgi:hypothetical protein